MTKEKSSKKKRGEAAATGGGFNNGGTADLPGWPRGWHPRPETYFGSNSYDWHGWPSHMRSGSDPAFASDFGAFPRAAYPSYPSSMQPGGATDSQAAAARDSSNGNNSDSGKSQSEDSSLSATHELADHQGKQQHKRKRRPRSKAQLEGEGKASKGKQQQQQQQMDESNAKNKRYGFDEIKDLVRFRTDLQSKFETMSTHLELWLSIGDKMCEKGHPKRAWESYRDKWDIELRRYQKELKNLLAQSENKELDNSEQLVFTDDVLQEIHRRLNTRPKVALRSRFQSGMGGGGRGCLGAPAAAAAATTTGVAPAAAAAAAAGGGDEGIREVAGKRMKKTANNQVLVDTIVDKVVDKIGSFEDTATAQGLKDILEAVVNLTNVISAEVQQEQVQVQVQQHHFTEALEIDDKVFTWLKGIGKEQFASHFAAAQVDWSNLMLLDREDLLEMKIPLGPRKSILRELDKIRPEPLAATAPPPPQPDEEV